jgi:hypothetical protein
MSVQVVPRGRDGERAPRGLDSVVVLAVVAAASAALGVWFVLYTRPEPGRFQKTLFFTLLALIALELRQAWRQRRPLAGGPRVIRVGAPPAAAHSSPGAGALAFILGLGGFLAFLWGTVGGLLVRGEANFIWIGFGTLGILLGAVFMLQGEKGDAARGQGPR